MGTLWPSTGAPTPSTSALTAVPTSSSSSPSQTASRIRTAAATPPALSGPPRPASSGSGDRQLLATGDDFGLVNLFRDPCRNGGLPRSLRGHSEHVVRVKFGAGDSKLFSIGGYDQTLMQWQRK